MSHWIYKGMMAAGMVGASLVTAGVLPLTFAAVAAAVTGAAALFHEAPGATPKS